MKKIVIGAIYLFLFYQSASAGVLSGRLIKEDGGPLGEAGIAIEGNKITTNEFGGYKVLLQDGERELKVEIDGSSYTSEKIKIYSPEVKQNWKVDSKNKKLLRIR